MSKWTIPLDRLAKKRKETLEKTVQRSTFQLFDEVQLRSPVDTGRFRGNWQTTEGNPAEGTLDVLDPSGALAHAQALKALTIPAGWIVYYTNNLPYGRRLEYDSWSRQAPAGMVRVSVNEFVRSVKALLR